jgi:hypothetical protein
MLSATPHPTTSLQCQQQTGYYYSTIIRKSGERSNNSTVSVSGLHTIVNSLKQTINNSSHALVSMNNNETTLTLLNASTTQQTIPKGTSLGQVRY